MIVLGVDCPVTAFIVLKVIPFNECAVVVLVLIGQLTDVRPVVILAAVVVIDPFIQQMILVRGFGM